MSEERKKTKLCSITDGTHNETSSLLCSCQSMMASANGGELPPMRGIGSGLESVECMRQTCAYLLTVSTATRPSNGFVVSIVESESVFDGPLLLGSRPMLSLASEKLGVGQDCTSVDGNRSFRISLRILGSKGFLSAGRVSGWTVDVRMD